MSKFKVTGKLTTDVALRYTSETIPHGKWSDQPGGVVDKDAVDQHLFTAENRSSSSTGPEGSASYVAADGTKFEFYFSDPETNSNYCKSEMSDVGGPWSLPTPSYPRSGKTWSVSYSIKSTASFCDAPVFTDDILASARCDDYPDRIVKRWIGDRTGTTLGEILSHGEIPLVGKVWCASHPLFLTAASKAILMRDLATSIVDGASVGREARGLLDSACELSEAAQNGNAGPAALAAVAERLDRGEAAALDDDPGSVALLDVARAMTLRNPSDGWADAVSSYLGDADGDAWDRRGSDVLKIVEARL